MAASGFDGEPPDDETRQLTAWGSPPEAPTPSAASADPVAPTSTSLDADARVDAATDLLRARRDPAERYEDLGLLGRGGMGEVRRVHDRLLGRTAAMKRVRADRAGDAATVARFLEEAQATARLEHPGIVPVHDLGVLQGGGLYFVMREIHGQTFREAIVALHAGDPLEGWTFKRLVGALARAAEAVAYAHDRGILHRDLKPSNLMLGAFGEVLVVDWGLAALGGEGASAGAGAIAGTPAYMAPEQARGDRAALGPATDVYALGACLFHLLTGRPPFEGDPAWILLAVQSGPPAVVPRVGDADLASLTRATLASDPSARGTAASLARALQAWLDGAQRREHALTLVEAADAADPEVRSLEARALELRRQVEAGLATVRDWDPVATKQAVWEVEDRAREVEAEARARRQQARRDLYGALAWDAAAPEVRAALAARHRRQHADAEMRGDLAAAEAELGLLRDHVDALPATHPDRAGHLAWIDGAGALSLTTDPPARVRLFRYREVRRQLVAVPVGDLGQTPILRHRLPMGSYLLVLSAEGCTDVHYPVWIPRQRHWDGCPPGSDAPRVVRLPRQGALGPEDHLVPGGWFRAGADPSLANAFPPTDVWLDDLVVRRHPVRLSEYLAFLDDLVADGRIAEAMRRVPHPPKADDPVADGVGFDGAHFVLQADQDGDLWQPDWPTIRIDADDARAFAAWEAERTGQPWRLPTEVEWEKAARGVDGRLYPWGDHGDFAFSNLRRSHPDGLRILPVDHPMLDVGPYGLVGMAGNVVCWTDSAYDEGIAPDARGRLPDRERDANTRISTRGGAFTWSLRAARAPDRKSLPAFARSEVTGIRLVRDFLG